MITDNDSTMKNPEEMSSGKNIPVHAAIAANAPPSAKDPILPINTDALYLLCRRNPTQDPAIEAPNIARSEQIGRTAIDIPVNANAAIPPASPSRASANLTPCPMETKQNEVKSW